MANCLAGYGERFADHDDYRFPSVERLAEVTESELRTNAFGYRARTIPLAAREVLQRGGDRYLAELRALPYRDAHREFATLPGVGPKIADCVCLFGTGHTEAVPVDTHIWQAATRLVFPEWQGETLTRTRYEAIGDRLRDHFGLNAGWVQQFLFVANRSLGRQKP